MYKLLLGENYLEPSDVAPVEGVRGGSTPWQFYTGCGRVVSNSTYHIHANQTAN
jgi:hypothetical protein